MSRPRRGRSRRSRPKTPAPLARAAVVVTLWAGTACGAPNGGRDTGAVEEAGGDAIAEAEGVPTSAAGTVASAGALSSEDYCRMPEVGADVLALRPDEGEASVDDVNWFARPVPHDGEEWIVAFASHDQNHLYDLTHGSRVRIPDRSDAVATPDGRYMTVPSYYTPDSTVRFYPVAPMLEALRAGEDADDLEPVFAQDHPAMRRVYYQSTALVGERTRGDTVHTTYRLMFSGTNHESRFRIADYVFSHSHDGRLLDVTASDPMAICPAVENDLNTPFISKDGRYVAAYTSETTGNAYAPGSTLKIFELTSVDAEAGTSTCREVVDLGLAAGKADFSFDGSMLTFHLSQGAYLTPFVNGGLPGTTITDVMVARLDRDAAGRIVGHSGLQRLSTSLTAGVGSYFPAFFPDGRLFYVSNTVPREAEGPKRFHFRVVDPGESAWRTRTLASEEDRALWTRLGDLWQEACVPSLPEAPEGLFPLDEHEVPLHGLSLTVPQCTALVRDARESADGADASRDDWDALMDVCRAVEG